MIQVAVSRLGLPILGTGSADQTAKVAIGDDNEAYGDNDDHDEDNGDHQPTIDSANQTAKAGSPEVVLVTTVSTLSKDQETESGLC